MRLGPREHAVLAVIEAHDGQWYWYQVDRALSQSGSAVVGVGPFMEEIGRLTAAGFIAERPCADQPGAPHYWVTDAGRAALARVAPPGTKSRD